MDLEQMKYPIGFYKPDEIKIEMIDEWIEDLRSFPKDLAEVVVGLDTNSLKFTYRPEGWNIQQVVHHIADSHMNAIIRFKLALSEDSPLIKPYLESEWAKMNDVKEVPIEASLQIIFGVHMRLVSLLSNMDALEFARTYLHPEHENPLDLFYMVGLYAWHGKHHLAHIRNALETKKVFWV